MAQRRQSMNLLTQQTKELVRRKTEILVHGSEVEQEKEEDHHKNWTLRRMQTRGTCSFIVSSNLTNNIFFSQRKNHAFGEIRTYDNDFEHKKENWCHGQWEMLTRRNWKKNWKLLVGQNWEQRHESPLSLRIWTPRLRPVKPPTSI